MKKFTKVAVVLLMTVMFLKINVSAIDNYEPNDSFSNSYALSGSNTKSYISSSTDEDYYMFIGSNMVYTYVTSPADTNYDVYLYDDSYNLIGSTLNSNMGNVIAKATAPGENYYLKVVSRDGSYDGNNRYSLIVYFKFPFM